MKKVLLIALVAPLLFFSCEKESGELFDDSPTTPDYSQDFLKKVWSSQINFSEFDYSESIFQFTIIENVILRSNSYYIFAHSADDGEFLWAFERPPLFSLPSLDDVTMVGDKLYFFSSINQRPGIVALNKYSGELESTLSFDDIPDINGFLLVRCFHDNKVYFSTKKANRDPHDYFDYSYFVYEFELETQSLNLLYNDESIFFQWDYSRVDPVVNSMNKSLFFQHIKHDSEDFYVQIVEIPNNGGEAEVVVSDKLESEVPSYLRSKKTFAVQGNYLVGNFERNAEFSMRTYDLTKGGERIWQSTTSFVPGFHMDNLYFIRHHSSGSLQHIDIQSGDVFWSQNINASNFSFLQDRPLACHRTNSGDMSILDLNTGTALVNLSFEDLGISPTSNYFHPNAFSYNHGEKLILATYRGQLLCFELPF